LTLNIIHEREITKKLQDLEMSLSHVTSLLIQIFENDVFIIFI